jgi:parallel beta-helix repeat protein
MNNRRLFSLILSLSLPFAALAILFLIIASLPTQAQNPTVHYVAPGGDCGGATPCYATVQAAVDATNPGGVIKVATGIYTGVSARPSPPGYHHPSASGFITQVVYISKTVIIQGGYTAAFTEPSNSEANPTTLDAQRSGRVVFIIGDISPTVEGLRITGGDAAGLGSWQRGVYGCGGGVYVISATAAIRDTQVFSNTAHDGGGLYLLTGAATLSGNTVSSNTAAYGGGLYLETHDATLSGNTIISNTAAWCGGLLLQGFASLSGNTFTGNTAIGGGGLCLNHDGAALSGNNVSANAAEYGGGLYLFTSAATLSGNTVSANTAEYGGGLYLDGSWATLSSNTVSSNTANNKGGGLYLIGGYATLSGNTVISNTAYDNGGGLHLGGGHVLSGNTVISNTAYGNGGGLCLRYNDATLTNNVVAGNQANSLGSGLYIQSSSLRLLHTTLARNGGGNGSGLYITEDHGPSTVVLTNTILVSHSVGITVTAGNTATLESTLWYSNTTADWGGEGTVITGAYNYWDDPLFDADGYHLTSDSAAIDKGVDSHVATDMDGDPRIGIPDIGADECVEHVYLPLTLRNR